MIVVVRRIQWSDGGSRLMKQNLLFIIVQVQVTITLLTYGFTLIHRLMFVRDFYKKLVIIY